MKTGSWFLGIVLLLTLSGCASLSTPGVQAGASGVSAEARVKIGMLREQVAALMDHAVTVGVEIDPVTGATKPVEIPSLYATEFLAHNNKSYLVDLYILKKDVVASGSPADETMPFIFENGILVGKGSDALKSLQTP